MIVMGQFTNYNEYVEKEAKSFVEEFEVDLIDEIKDGNTDVHSYVHDYRLHEWVDNDFIYVDLKDSADILEQSDNVETDSGLWEGQEPRKAIETQAFFTYRNDLGEEVMERFKDILERKMSEVDSDLDELREEQADEMDNDKYDEFEPEIEKLESFLEYLEEAIDSI